jgi:hypothetical protein
LADPKTGKLRPILVGAVVKKRRGRRVRCARLRQ